MHRAVHHQAKKIMRWLADKKPSLLEEANCKGRTPLQDQDRCNEGTNLLHEVFRPVNIANGEDTIYCSPDYVDFEQINWLLNHDPSLLEKTNGSGNTPLHLAVGETEGSTFIEMSQAYWSPHYVQEPNYLCQRERSGPRILSSSTTRLEPDQKNHLISRLDVVQWMADHNPSLLHKTNQYKRTPLHAAIRNNQLEISQWMLERDPSLLELLHQDPHLLKGSIYNFKTIKWLTERYPALVDEPDQIELTPLEDFALNALEYASKNNELEGLEWLVNRDSSFINRALQKSSQMGDPGMLAGVSELFQTLDAIF